ncbi:MAG: minor capsid protein [Oscillospiraceae bacterium]|nr:minor capsid protein [Oscillospiraceae bacterium]
MEFSKEKEKWLESRKTSLKGYYVGDTIAKAKHADVYYREALDKELDRFISSLQKELKSVYSVIKVENAATKRKPSIASVRIVLNAYKNAKLKILLKNSRKIIEKWLKLATNATDKSIKKILFNMAGKELAIEYDSAYDEALKLMIQRNVQLITNTATQTLTNIENIVYNGMTTGRGWKDLEGEMYKQTHISRDRIKLIAQDQTNKTNQALNQLGQQAAGIKYFEWWGAADERERELHWVLNGKIFKWGDSPERLPIIDTYGTRGYPGDAVRCRCSSRPVWIMSGYKAVWQGDNKGYKIIKSR